MGNPASLPTTQPSSSLPLDPITTFIRTEIHAAVQDHLQTPPFANASNHPAGADPPSYSSSAPLLANAEHADDGASNSPDNNNNTDNDADTEAQPQTADSKRIRHVASRSKIILLRLFALFPLPAAVVALTIVVRSGVDPLGIVGMAFTLSLTQYVLIMFMLLVVTILFFRPTTTTPSTPPDPNPSPHALEDMLYCMAAVSWHFFFSNVHYAFVLWLWFVCGSTTVLDSYVAVRDFNARVDVVVVAGRGAQGGGGAGAMGLLSRCLVEGLPEGRSRNATVVDFVGCLRGMGVEEGAAIVEVK